MNRMELRDRSRDEAGILIREAATEGDAKEFVGHAAVFNSRTAIGNPLTWGFYEEVNSGAFTKTLKEGDARFLVDHDTSLLVARVSAGDLRLAEDDIGLAVDSDLDLEVSYIRDLNRNVDKRRVTGMSIGFQVVKDDWRTEEVEVKDNDPIEVEVRTIQEIRLFEVSAVTFPAYEETDAAVRALALRDDPDPLGRRSHLIDRITAKQHEPGGSTRADDREPANATRLYVAQADADLQLLALRYGIELPTRP
jgi:HK97 family phage prohead protease